MKGRCVILAPKKVKERRQNMITTTMSPITLMQIEQILSNVKM
jgi:hypothetical protein